MKKFIVSMLVAIGLTTTAMADGHHRYIERRPVVCNQPVRYYTSPRYNTIVYSTPIYSRPFRREYIVYEPCYTYVMYDPCLRVYVTYYR